MQIPFVHETFPSKVVFGRGVAAEVLSREIGERGWSRVMTIASPRDADLLDRLTGAVADVVVASFAQVRQHVPRDTAVAARAVAAEHDVDAVVVLGGGSAIGTAKIVALERPVPVLAVPTTYAGSEMTPVWGMTVDGVKSTGRAVQVQPGVVVYDPDLTDALPVPLAVASSFNALAHCLEVSWSPRASPAALGVALEGVRSLAAGLRTLLEVPGHEGRPDELLVGAFLAGTAFAATGSGLHHKICHVLGGAFDLPHAPTHTVLLPHVLAFNLDAMGERGRLVADALGGERAVDVLAELYRLTHAPTTLTEVGLDVSDLDAAVSAVVATLPIDNVRPVDAAAVETILRGATGAR